MNINVNGSTASPTSVVSGTPSSKLTVTSAQAKSALTGLTNAYDFGDVAVGAESALVTPTVTNLSSDTITVQQPAAGDTDPFSIVTGGTCVATGGLFTLAGGSATCTVFVMMTGRVDLDPSVLPSQENPAIHMTFQAVDESSVATALLTGRTVRPAGLQVVGLPTSGAVAIDLGTIVNPNGTAPVTLKFENPGDVDAKNLKFQWSKVAGDLTTCSGASTDRSCDPFVVATESGSRTSCYNLTTLAAHQVCYLSISSQPTTSATEGGASQHFTLTANGGIAVATTFQVKSLVRTSAATSSDVYFDYTNKTQFGFLPFTALTSGTTAVGANSAQGIVTIENKSGSTVTLTTGASTAWAIALSDAVNFSVVAAGTNACGATLANNSSCTIGVTFTPKSYTSATKFKFASLDLAAFGSNVTNTLGLVGEVTAPALLTLAPASLAFGDVLINDSGTLSVVVKNTGEADATAISISNTNAAVFNVSGCAAGVPAGTSCTLTATAVPTAAGQTGTLNVFFAGGNNGAALTDNSPAVANMTVNGVTAASIAITGTGLTVVSANAQALDIGGAASTPLVVGAGTHQDEVLTITNSHTQSTGKLAIGLTGNADSYTIDMGTCADADGVPIALLAGASCAVTVTFAPATQVGTTVPGAVATTLSVSETQSSTTITKTVAITGHAKSALDFYVSASSTTPLVSPTTVTAPATSDPKNGKDIFVKLTSPPNGPTAMLSTASLSGDDVASFYITQNTCLFSQLQNTDNVCVITVEYVGGTTTTTKKTTLKVSDGTTGYTNAIVVQFASP